jgi:hypothetical protein
MGHPEATFTARTGGARAQPLRRRSLAIALSEAMNRQAAAQSPRNRRLWPPEQNALCPPEEDTERVKRKTVKYLDCTLGWL